MRQQTIRRGVVVLGMHRSGTSAVTELLHRLGLPVGAPEGLMPPTPANPRGYWEQTALSSLNEEILEYLGGSWSAPPQLAEGWVQDETLLPLRESAIRCFRDAFGEGPFVWKDARLCLTWPFWRELIAQPVAIVIVLRHPGEIARSLARRDGFTKALGLALWERYLRAALGAAEGAPTLVVRYERLLAKPSDGCATLLDFLETIGLRGTNQTTDVALDEVLDSNLRHEWIDGSEERIVSASQRGLFRLLENLVGSHSSLHVPILTEETPWIEALLFERRAALKRIDDLSREDRAKQGTIEVLRREGTEKQETIEALRREGTEKQETTEALRREGTEKQETIEALRREGTEKQETIEALRREGTERQETIEALRREGTERQETIEALRSNSDRLALVARTLIGELAAHMPSRDAGPEPEDVCLPPDAAESPEAYREWLARMGEERAVRARRSIELLREGGAAPSVAFLVADCGRVPSLVREWAPAFLQMGPEGWQVCVVRCCDSAAVDDPVAALHREDLRIHRIVRHDHFEITAAWNLAAAVADADYLCLLDPLEEPDPVAPGELRLALRERPEVDVLYTDEDARDVRGLPEKPHFKPDWSPDLLTSWNYIGGLFILRRELFEVLGGVREDVSLAAARYDLVLRATERAGNVAHLPEILAHRHRETHIEEQPALNGNEMRQVLAESLSRRGEDAGVLDGALPGTFRIRRRLHGALTVSAIVPFRDQANLLRECVDSLQRAYEASRLEIVLLDNRSWEPETQAVLQRLREREGIRIVSWPEAFNWSAVNNFGAREATGDVFLFCNNDVEAFDDGWLEAMLEHVQRSEVGVVGARLLYPGGRVQHAGVVLGPGGVAAHAGRGLPGDHPGYFGAARVIRNCSAVTGAVLLVRRAVFEEVGGFDETLAVAFNDVDFCLRVMERGYRVIYTPFTELRHHESISRGMAFDSQATRIIQERWEPWIDRDPYYNPNLSLRSADWALPSVSEPIRKLL